MKKIAKTFLILVFSLIILFFGCRYFTFAQTAEEISADIKKYEEEISRLSSQSKTLSNQIAQFNAQIKLTTLKIAQTEEKISLLGGRIDRLEGSLDSLTNAYTARVTETYKMLRVEDPVLFILAAPDLNSVFERFHYLKSIQEADQDLLQRLQMAQINYKVEKTDQEVLQNQLNKEKQNLNNQKSAKANLIISTNNDEKKYQQLLATAKAQLAAISRYVLSQGGASILSNQTKCDGWGCYYNQRDSEWGNMSLGGNPYSVANYGCLVSSVAMVASHMGKNIKPSDIAGNSSAFFPGTGFLLWSFSVNGYRVTITSASKAEIDSRLSDGKAVIAGLYSGPDHFVVIVRKEGDSYIIHDPFPENGAYRPLTEKYSIGSINSLRVVDIN
jgi:peptidoglycan hydrolase CwlO-like protein